MRRVEFNHVTTLHISCWKACRFESYLTHQLYNEQSSLIEKRCTAKRNIVLDIGNKYIPCTILNSNPFDEIPKKYKLHWGIRYSGITTDDKLVLYGYDVFKQTSANGIDLESLLYFGKDNNLTIDFYNYVRTAIHEKWNINTIIRKLKYPIIDVYSEDHWNHVYELIKKMQYV